MRMQQCDRCKKLVPLMSSAFSVVECHMSSGGLLWSKELCEDCMVKLRELVEWHLPERAQ